MGRYTISLSLLVLVFCRVPTFADDSAGHETIDAALSNIRETGTSWMENRGCVSCHQIPAMIWSYESARRAGTPVEANELDRWEKWATQVVNFVKPALKEDFVAESAMERNVDTMTHLLLAIPKRNDESWRQNFADRLVELQAENGSWNACGQLPAQRRPKNETNATTTIWTALALTREDVGFDLQAATEFADTIGQPVSTEFVAARLLLAAEIDNDQAEAYRKMLQRNQNDDGGWGWKFGEPSDALGTGYALYALAATGSDGVEIRSARKYLIESQTDSGGWLVPGTKSSAKGRPTETANDWGSAWAVIALAESG